MTIRIQGQAVKVDTLAVLKGKSLCWLCNGGCDRLLIGRTGSHTCDGSESCVNAMAIAALQRPPWWITGFALAVIWK